MNRDPITCAQISLDGLIEVQGKQNPPLGMVQEALFRTALARPNGLWEMTWTLALAVSRLSEQKEAA